MLTPVIIYAIDVGHIGHIYKSAVSLVKTSFIKPFLHGLTSLTLECEAEIHRCFPDHLLDVPVNLLVLTLGLLDLTHGVSPKRSKAFFGHELITVRADFFYNRMLINHLIIRDKESLQNRGVGRKGKLKESAKLPDTFIIACVLNLTLIIQAETGDTIIGHDIDTSLVFIRCLHIG